MNAAATLRNEEFASPELSDPCNFVVLSEDAAAYEAAMDVCERLSSQFSEEMFFVFRCWNLKELSTLKSEEIARAVADADVIIFATRGDDLPYPVRKCLESATERRFKRDGALGLLLVNPPSPSAAIGSLLSRLEYASARLHMDFLPMLSSQDGTDLQVSVTTLLKGLMEQPPSHWGLNE